MRENMWRGRKNAELEAKIANLQLKLAPLVPLPVGEAHPAFPSTLLAYHLLTEDELDSLAHHYHQSTPTVWTHQYPECMNWDKEWLNASKQRRRSSLADLSSLDNPHGEEEGQMQLQLQQQQQQHHHHQEEQVPDWFTELITASEANESSSSSATTPTASRKRSASAKPSKGLTDAERIGIKRRKVGKFIGLLGMETPETEIEGRMREAMERVIQAGHEEMRLVEEWYMGRRKMG